MRAITSDRARIQRMLDFCTALARAEAALGIIPASAAGEIANAGRVERYDIDALLQSAAERGDLAEPVVAALTAEIAGSAGPEAAPYVNHGAAPQDMIDTALVLELSAAIEALISDVTLAIDGFSALAGRHRRTIMAARNLAWQSGPIPFGLKLSGYAAGLSRARERLRRLRKDALALQFGGRTGTLATFADKGLDVTDRLAAQLDLPIADAPWHSQRDRLADVASVFAILATTCGKIARDIALLMQTEIGELAFPPQNANDPAPDDGPRLPALALAAAIAAPSLAAVVMSAQIQEHEAAAGLRYAEWSAFPALELATSSAVAAIAEMATTMQPDPERMAENLERPGGIAMGEPLTDALAARIGRKKAEALVVDLCRIALTAHRPFREVAEKDARLREYSMDRHCRSCFSRPAILDRRRSLSTVWSVRPKAGPCAAFHNLCLLLNLTRSPPG